MSSPTTLSPALRMAEKLLVDPPENPDVSRGYLDLIGPGPPTLPIRTPAPTRSGRTSSSIATMQWVCGKKR